MKSSQSKTVNDEVCAAALLASNEGELEGESGETWGSKVSGGGR